MREPNQSMTIVSRKKWSRSLELLVPIWEYKDCAPDVPPEGSAASACIFCSTEV